VEVVAVTSADAHGGSRSLLTSNRTATFRGPAFDVTNVMFNGSRYHVEVWAKLAPGEANTQLRVSLDRKLGTALETFTTVVPNTTVTAGAWVLLAATIDMNLANTSLVLYVESASGLPSFYIDDFKITFISPAVAERDIPSVYQTVADQFPVGAAVRTADLSGEAAFLLTRHYNSMTSENDMKWDATEPTEGTFTFATADAEVAFAKANNMRVRGHTLVWHNQTPAWVFNDASGNPMTPTPENRALLLQRMQNHIRAVVTHFGTDVGTWDVVNEVIDPSQPDGYRRSPWFNIIGPDYIDVAFQTAREVAPTAKLYINEFSTTDATKRAFLAGLVSGLKGRGVPVDGVGHQMHNNVDFPSGQSIVDTVNVFYALGVENSITELDASIYSGSFTTPVLDYTNIPQDRFLRQGYRYLTFFQAFKQLQGKIASVTLWGKADDHTWLTSATQVDGPLLFDISLKKKLAYWAIVDPLQLPGADLSTAISAAPTTVPAGQAVAYTISVTNNADTDTAPFKPTDDDLPAANVTLATAVPAHTVFQALSVPAGWSCATPAAGGSGPVQCTVASLPAGATAVFTLTVALADCAASDASTILASATVSSTTADPNPAPNNSASAGVQVSNAPPVITPLGALDTTVECHTSFVDPGATATDACQGPVAVATSSTLDVNQVGTYAVSYDAVDQAGGHAAPVVRTVHVADTTPPVVTVLGPNPAVVECATGFIDPGATATDSCAGAVAVVTTGAVDVNVPGSTGLGYAATDPSGNTGFGTRLVTVDDTTAPTIDVVDLTILAPHLKIVVEDQTVTIDGQRSSRRSCGHVGRDGHDIVFDGTTIRIDGRVVPTDGRTVVLLPPDHDYQTFTITDLVSSVTDSCDASLGLAGAVITQVTSDEPEDGTGRGGGHDGHTRNDIVIAADCRSAQLRVEREGGGNGRVYTLALHAQDAAGNRVATSVQVMVPPNDDTGAAVDDGARYTVTSACP
jgi:GH35 family endo-1,4-beta-xylanase